MDLNTLPIKSNMNVVDVYDVLNVINKHSKDTLPIYIDFTLSTEDTYCINSDGKTFNIPTYHLRIKANAKIINELQVIGCTFVKYVSGEVYFVF
jgi:hypothetical protein